MTTDERKKLMEIYEILSSGRVHYAKYLLEQLLGIQETVPDPEVA